MSHLGSICTHYCRNAREILGKLSTIVRNVIGLVPKDRSTQAKKAKASLHEDRIMKVGDSKQA